MLPEILELAKNPLVLAALAVGIILGMGIEQLLAGDFQKAGEDKRPWPWKKQRPKSDIPIGPWSPFPAKIQRRPLDAADQLRVVMGADFTVQPLLNRSEARVLKELDDIVLGRNPTWQVMAQVSLGEVLRCKDAIAFSCINSKRVDLLLMDGDCRPRHAIEYQGGGHYQGTAAARDAVKKEALRRAGIGYHEVISGHTTPADLRRLIEKIVERPESRLQDQGEHSPLAGRRLGPVDKVWQPNLC